MDLLGKTMINQILSYWDQKGTLEKIFWISFVFAVIFSLFYLFGFDELLARYKTIKDQKDLISFNQATLTNLKSPTKILQEILQPNKNINIENLESKGNIHTLIASGDFLALTKLLKFIESFNQNEILDYSLKQKEKMHLFVRFYIARNAFIRNLENKEASLVFFSPRVMDLEIIINHKARISNQWYKIGDNLFGMRIKDITPISVILENAEHQEITIGL